LELTDCARSRQHYQPGQTRTSGNADRFLEFIEKELVPWTEATYRTAPLRVLAGHSAGGNFALHAMRVRPALFQAIIAASPWLAWDDRKELKLLLPFLASADFKARALFFTCADEGPEMNADIDALASALRARKDGFLRWDSATYPNETHDSTVIKSYFDALRMIFAGWSFPARSADESSERVARLYEGLLREIWRAFWPGSAPAGGHGE
jgi:predicted alpha/beta superfamily hydrolase